MALVYPVPADTPDADDGTEPDFAELAADPRTPGWSRSGWGRTATTRASAR